MTNGWGHRRAWRWLAAVVATASGLVLPLVAPRRPRPEVARRRGRAASVWSDALTWAPDGVPGGSDSVCISTGDVSVRSSSSAASVDVSSGAALHVIGNGSFGNVSLTLSAASTNAGTIELTSEGGGWSSFLTGGSLASSGTLLLSAGAGGQRFFDTPVASSGTWTVSGSTSVNGSTADSSSGSINVNPGASLTFNNTSSLTQTAGSLVVDGALTFGVGHHVHLRRWHDQRRRGRRDPQRHALVRAEHVHARARRSS